MSIRLHLISLLLWGLTAICGQAQRTVAPPQETQAPPQATQAPSQATQAPPLNIGDPAPPLRLRAWLKGEPIDKFEKGRVYAIEFWATWCKPCKAAMPHLSALAHAYKNNVRIIGIDCYEQKTMTPGRISAFVDSMGQRMDYKVATQDSDLMEVDWLRASGEQGIPKAFIINREGQVAWIGHPHELDKVLPEMVSDRWDIKQALADRNRKKYLDSLDGEVQYELAPYRADPLKPDDPGKPDSALLALNDILRKEPGLKYRSGFAANNFICLLKTNPQKAYEFGNEMLVASTYEDDLYGIIYGNIEAFSAKLHLSPEFSRLAAEAHQAQIDRYPGTDPLPAK